MARLEKKDEAVVSTEEQIPLGIKLIQEVKPQSLNSVFCAMRCDDQFETFNFDGTYAMMRHKNPHPNLKAVIDTFYDRTIEHMRSKAIFVQGNILYKDAPGVKEAIDYMVAITTMNKLPSSVDASVLKRTQMLSGTICPTKDVLFRHKGMLFVIYGRYIYGYDSPYVRFLNQEKLGLEYEYTPEHYEKCERNDEIGEEFIWDLRRKPVISNDEIILPTVSYEEKDYYMNDYNYSFCILEESSNTLLAFSVYR